MVEGKTVVPADPMLAQRDYYTLPSTSSTLDLRAEAIASSLPAGARLIDLGCNDGSMARHLLAAGAASSVIGYDLELLAPTRIDGFEPRVANLLSFDLSELPDADGVLMLNVLHHLLVADEKRALDILEFVLRRYQYVFVDLGSVSEVGSWSWLAYLKTRFATDKQVWDTVFAPASLRFKLLRYPMQGGFRVLWKLYRQPYEIGTPTTLSTFGRTIGSWGDDKRLVPDTEVHDLVLEPSVRFEIKTTSRCDKLFVKTYIGVYAERIARLEYRLSRLARKALDDLARFGVEERKKLRVAAPIAVSGSTLFFAYEPDLFSARPGHHQDWDVCLPREDARASHIISCAEVELGRMPPSQLLTLCDFQVCNGWDGLAMLDFAPNAILLEMTDDNFRGVRVAGDDNPANDEIDMTNSALQTTSLPTSIAETSLPGRLISPHEIARVPRAVREALSRERVRPFRLDGDRAIATMLARWKIFVDVRDIGFSCHILTDGYWEMWLTEFLIGLIKPGMHVIDVGANFGYYTLLMSDLIGADGRALAVEPNPRVAAELTCSLAINGFRKRTRLLQKAASDSAQQATFFVPHREPKNGQLVAAGFSAPHGETFSVDTIALDDVLVGEPKVDFIKIDAEGAEYAIMQGLRQIIERDRPMMIVEFNAARPSADKLLEMMHAMYGKVSFLDFDGVAKDVGQIDLLVEKRGQDWLLFLQ